MKVTHRRIALIVLSIAAVSGLVLALHAGQGQSQAVLNNSSKVTGGASSSQWVWQNPLPQGNNLRGASFVDANTGTVVGDYGTIVRTTDGGNSWTIQVSGTTQNLWAVSFIDANRGTAVGEGGTILRTTDGGNSWLPQSSGTANFLFGVSFIDANTGTAVGGACGIGGESTILRTTDGGGTWIKRPNPGTVCLFKVSLTDANTGTAVGEGGVVLRTINGGNTWPPQKSGSAQNLQWAC